MTSMETIWYYLQTNPVFYIFAFLSVGLSVLMLSARNPVYSAIFMIKALFCLAVIYITLEAEFIAAIQVLIYTGAIMVLFLFVVMLLNIDADAQVPEPHGPMTLFSIIAAFGVFVLVGQAFLYPTHAVPQKGIYPIEIIREFGHVETLATVLFSKYLYPFEIASMVLLLGMIGALLIAKRKFD